MPSGRAHLLLPTRSGLVRYDLLEEAAFLGPSAKGGASASPTPFPKARLALTRDAAGFRVRALPGEAPASVDGRAAEGALLSDGARITLEGEVVLFRWEGGPAPVAVAPPVLAARSEPAAAPPPDAAPSTSDGHRATLHAALALLGAALLLFGVYRAVKLLEHPPARPVPSTPVVAEPERGLPRSEARAAEAYAAAAAYEKESPDDVAGAVARWRSVARDHAATAEGVSAAARVSELWPRAGAAAWQGARASAQSYARDRKFGKALKVLREHERTFLGSETGEAARALGATIRAEARTALDTLKAQVAPLLAADPSRAYHMLTTHPLDLPSDLEAELATLMARARETAAAQPPKKKPEPRPPSPPPERPTPPREEPRREPVPGQPGAGAGGASEVWSAARAHLAAKRWKEALAAYDDLLARHGSSEIVVANRLRVDAGRKAADAGVRGPPALLRRPSRWKDGRLEVEYTFDSVEEMKADFAVEQPFPGNLERRAEWGDGMALLTGSTALLHAIVYEPDLAWEAEFFSDDPHDFGLFALQEAKPYRAVSFEAGNTAKKLKKGAAAKVLAGHVLWLIGDGAWSATDPDELGFIFLDRTQSPRLEPAKKVRLSLAIRNGNAEAHLRTEADSASLSGAVRGDDGKGLGPLRPGVFAYTSLVGVERLKIEGKVDAAWFERRLGELAALDVGP